MGRLRFVQPEVVRIPISDSDFIDIKKELTAGEQRLIYSSLVKTLSFGEKAVLDPRMVGMTKIMAYLVAWSFTDSDGRPVSVSESAVNNLDLDSYSEIEKAIDAHDAAAEAARVERKNVQGTPSASPAT